MCFICETHFGFLIIVLSSSLSAGLTEFSKLAYRMVLYPLMTNPAMEFIILLIVLSICCITVWYV